MRPSFEIRGVVEGFYGRPWSFKERMHLISLMKQWHLNTYMYAPKFDPEHRLRWRKNYSDEMITDFENLNALCKDLEMRFVFGLSPGLDIQTDDPGDLESICCKLKQMYRTGVKDFALLMDDIPFDTSDPESQAALIKHLMKNLPDDISWFFCPTVYSGWHLKKHPAAEQHLECLGRLIPGEVTIFWTGSSIVSRSIHEDDLVVPNRLLRRKVLIWDNFCADDYVPAGTIFCGPIADRSPGLPSCVKGVLLNPSQNFHLSLLPIATVASYTSAPDRYNPEKAWKSHLHEFFKDNAGAMELILGYFYNPAGISSEWSLLLRDVEEFLQGPRDGFQSMEAKINQALDLLHDEYHLLHYQEWWQEIYPHVQTLYGDLKYLVDILKRCNEGIVDPLTRFPMRDVRWSSPIVQLITKLFRDQIKPTTGGI